MKYKPQGSNEKVYKQDYSKEIIFEINDLPVGGHMLQTVTINPHTKQRAHFHHKQTEVFYILEGECFIFINEREFLARTGDSFICSPKDKHYLWNKTDNPFKLIVFKIDKPEDDDTVWME